MGIATWVYVLCGSIAVPVVLAGAVVIWPWSVEPKAASGLDFSGTLAADHVPLPIETVTLRDGSQIAVRHAKGPAGAPLVVMVHGSGWHGQQFEGLAAGLADLADVLAPDLRGHGVAPARRGDVDYIGQFEDDLADLITARAGPQQKVVLLGHSSGGGLVVRFAGGEHRGLIDGAVLLAPFLHHSAPTTKANSGGWATVSLRRVIGLSVLNALRITALNGRPVIRFAMPEAVLNGPLGQTATTEYSYRLNTSYAPRADWQADVARLPPFLLVAGSKDEAFHAERYEPTLSPLNPAGRYALLPDVGHLDVVNADATLSALRAFLTELR